MSGMVLYGLLFPSLRIHLFTNQTNPGSSSSTLSQHPLVCGVIFIFIRLILVLFLPLLCHPTHPYLLSPHLIFHDSESSYSFYFYLPLCLLLGYGLCARPALNMYVYMRTGVCCWHSPDLISTWISLPPVSSTETLGLFLLITHFTCLWSAVPAKCSWHLGETQLQHKESLRWAWGSEALLFQWHHQECRF